MNAHFRLSQLTSCRIMEAVTIQNEKIADKLVIFLILNVDNVLLL